MLSLSAAARDKFQGNYAAYADVAYVIKLLAPTGCKDQFLFLSLLVCLLLLLLF